MSSTDRCYGFDDKSNLEILVYSCIAELDLIVPILLDILTPVSFARTLFRPISFVLCDVILLLGLLFPSDIIIEN